MSQNSDTKHPVETQETADEITVEEVNRVLEVGRLLLSVLSEEEIEAIQELLIRDGSKNEIGNAGVT